MDTRQQLVTLLAQRSAKRGPFVLSSGRTSDLYIDARLTSMSAEGLALIGSLGLAAIRDAFDSPPIDSVGGLTLGADPIAYAIAYASATSSHPVQAFAVRKEPKAHGAGRQVEGAFSPGDRVVVVEDVITTGGSALKAVDVLRAHQADVAGILALVDREEGGRELLERAGLRVISLARSSEILSLLPPT
jgi:orotate phosphoribosyltransferase